MTLYMRGLFVLGFALAVPSVLLSTAAQSQLR
jgi:hypothetical protein